MAGPVVAGILFSMLVVVLSVLRPNAGRLFLGIFFVLMGIGVNLTFVLTQPDFVYEYGQGSWLPLYRTLTERVIGLSPTVFGIALIVFEVLMGVLLLSRGTWVKVGLVGTAVFVLALVPIHPQQIAWIGPAVANVYLLTRSFDADVLTMIRTRRAKRRTA